MNSPLESPETNDTAESKALYDQRLAEYRDTLENYRKCILEYSGRLDSYEKRSVDNQLSIVQTALDLSYVKEQGVKSVELLEDLKSGPISATVSNLDSLAKAVLDISYKLESVDKNSVNRLSEFMVELQKQMLYQNKQLQMELKTEIRTELDQVSREVKKNHSLLWFILILQILGLSGLIFMVLYVLEIIPFGI